ncbi:hypothetical protein jhhlp_008116 [Lomentospora prolificans]|uniref:RNA-dependent RNA polymerase n=1 Tax=Lomentospora prolificans TaxID=41688 RepID=A0A2N3MZJ8_9PEZI|nr:hypothetical protein jhhlp_008116 [Lomentospora prolificans]
MEVYLQGLPLGLSQASFQSSLQGCMTNLGIVDWSCQDPGRRDFGFVLFLNASDGTKFLQRFGAVRTETPRLFILGKPIFASKGKRAPDKLRIRHLKYQKDQKALAPSALPGDSSVALRLRGIDCGHLVVHPTDGNLVFVRQCNLECDHKAVAKFATRTLILRYDDGFRVDIPFATIEQMVIDESHSAATLILTEVPRFFAPGRQLTHLMENLDLSAYGWQNASRLPSRIRTTHLQGCPEHANYVAHCLVYRIRFWSQYQEFIQMLSNIKRREINPLIMFSFREMAALPGTTDFPSAFRAFVRRTDEIQATTTVPFVILFQVQALVRNNFVTPSVATEILNHLETSFSEAKRKKLPQPYSVKSFKLLFQKIPYPSPHIEPERLSSSGILRQLQEIETRQRSHTPLFTGLEKERSARQSWVLKAVVTPTRILLQGPDLETNNRILRKFPDFTDHFLRVQFSEEDEEDLFFNPNVSNDLILKRFENVFRNGIQVAGRVYGFLGFSHSSLRSHSAWFSASFFDKDGNLQSYITIIKALGDFDRIRIPARCAARIGQAFSETPFSIHLPDHRITQSYIPDIKSPDGQRIFSDGVGTISLEAARSIWGVLPKYGNWATCLQIRWAGAKGMLSLDTRLKGRQFCIRKESMEKFKGTDSADLEICGMSSQPLRFVLNQQIIKILEDLGVNESCFLRLQKLELDSLKAVTKTAESTSAFLRSQDVGSEADLAKFIKRLNKRKIDYRMDPFLRSLIESVVLRELRLLKHKARIPVRKGVTLYGVLDETGFLEEDEVYVTFENSGQSVRSPIEHNIQDGRITVTRSPALHPGDVQVAIQRTPPAGHPLRALRNCIVFSQKGERDLPSKLSGGDLDGDIYNITWDPDLQPKKLYFPADYPRMVPEGLNRPVTKEDMANFFVNFMKTDQLGIIANRHLVIADKKDEGTMDSDCLKLAELHSNAVDFSKTGAPVDVSLMPNYKPRFRPDFLSPAPLTKVYDFGEIDFLDPIDQREDEEEAAPNYLYYKSEKILGKLYRNVDEKKVWAGLHRPPLSGGPSVWDQLIGVVEKEIIDLGLSPLIHWETKRTMASILQDGYEDVIMDMQEFHSPNTTAGLSELEVFCGTIFHRSCKPTRRQRESSIKLRERISEVITWLVGELRSGRVDLSLGPSPDEPLVPPVPARVRAIELCLACVHVATERAHAKGLSAKNHRRGRRAGERMQSFRVVAGATLLRELDRYRFDVQEAARRQKKDAEAGGYVGLKGRRR